MSCIQTIWRCKSHNAGRPKKSAKIFSVLPATGRTLAIANLSNYWNNVCLGAGSGVESHLEPRYLISLRLECRGVRTGGGQRLMMMAAPCWYQSSPPTGSQLHWQSKSRIEKHFAVAARRATRASSPSSERGAAGAAALRSARFCILIKYRCVVWHNEGAMIKMTRYKWEDWSRRTRPQPPPPATTTRQNIGVPQPGNKDNN